MFLFWVYCVWERREARLLVKLIFRARAHMLLLQEEVWRIGVPQLNGRAARHAQRALD